MRYLTFALAKGRLAKTAMKMFEDIGIECEEMKYNNMEFYIFSNLTNNKVDIMYYPVAL